MFEDVPKDQVDENLVFVFAFCDSLQIQTLHKYNSIILMNSTHGPCYSLENCDQKAFLYNILMKYDEAGCGVPATFMITKLETQRPLARWLTWLVKKSLLPKTPIVMIDCSALEMAAIKSASNSLRIRLCHWNMLQAMCGQVNKKFSSHTIAGQT